MSKSLWRRRWVKLWYLETFKKGGILDKLDTETVGIFFLMLAWAGDNAENPGIISFEGMGLSDEQYCGRLRISIDIFKKAVKSLTDEKMIVFEKGVINIVNFEHYQSEADRKRKYNHEDKRTFKQTPNKTATEGEGEGEVDKEEDKEKTKTRHSSADADPRPALIVENWNKIPGVRTCRLTANLRTKIITRLKDPEFSNNDNWLIGLRRAFHSSFIRGMTKKSAEHENWKASIYFFLKPAKFDMLMNGEYDDKKSDVVEERT